jgi:hypothetical protein
VEGARVNLSAEEEDLPRLAVVVDIGVERISGGMLLLYRLLSQYPRNRLCVVYDPSQSPANLSDRLPGVVYHPLPLRIPKWVRNRLNPFWPLAASVWARGQADQLLKRLEKFQPDAILSMPHWYLWFAADTAAKRLRVPLHLIVHDDWSCYTTFRRPGWLPDLVRWGCRKVMLPVYRRAASRLCISPGMVEQYRQWFGVNGTVLYPSRGDDSPPSKVRVREKTGGPAIVAFCGDIHLSGTADLLRQLADALILRDGFVDLYSRSTPSSLTAVGLDRPNVRLHGFFPASEMGERVARSAHCLFLPASFDLRERTDVATLFPSKLADYTAIGLPILIWGPAYSSAARWAACNPAAAALVTTKDAGQAVSAVERFATDPNHAVQVAAAGLAAGKLYFDPAKARQILLSALLGHFSQKL